MKFKFEFFLSVFVLAIAAMLLVPLPTLLIDLLVVLNLAFSFLILLVALYLPNALSLLSFPTLLLLSTLFRLALNVASSRLILSQGDAGVVIEAFGTLLVGGQIAVGIIIFIIITIVNFLVIARGSSRVSEVAARFALDAMPGKQATIDSDVRAGLISAAEAQKRRESLRKESQLYGAMDGSMKFVQGDAIAGFIIILTNIIGGLSIALSDGMPLADAFHTYTILTVGDGLVAQVPALLIAICAGIVVTRVSSSETATLGDDVATDLFAKPVLIIAVGAGITILGLLPGVPTVPFFAVGAVLVGVGFRLRSKQTLVPASTLFPQSGLESSSAFALGYSAQSQVAMSQAGSRILALGAGANHPSSAPHNSNHAAARITILLDRHALFSTIEPDLENIYARWARMRSAVELEFGVALPDIWIAADVRAGSGSIAVILDGIAIASMRVPLDSTVVALEPLQARALGFAVVADCADPLSGKLLSWVSNRSAAVFKSFLRFDAIDLAMRTACSYLLAHPEELVSIAETHASLTQLEIAHPGLFDSSLDRRFINPARATEIKRELLRAGMFVGDTRKLIEDVAHYCATYAKSELSASDFDLSDIVLHVRRLRLRQLAAAVSGINPLLTVHPTAHFSVEMLSKDGAQESSVRDLQVAIRSGQLGVCGVLTGSRVVNDAALTYRNFPHVTFVSESEILAPEFKSVYLTSVREDVSSDLPQ